MCVSAQTIILCFDKVVPRLHLSGKLTTDPEKYKIGCYFDGDGFFFNQI